MVNTVLMLYLLRSVRYVSIHFLVFRLGTVQCSDSDQKSILSLEQSKEHQFGT